MAVNLTDKWNQHAYPDETPGREERWSQESENRRTQDRTDLYLEQSGSGLKLRRFTSDSHHDADGRSAKDKAADDMMMYAAVGSPAWQAAYNTQLSFKIDGEDIEITQGELHERATKRTEELRRKIEQAKTRGENAEDIAELQAQLGRVIIVRDNTDPALGPMDPERHKRVQAALEGGAADDLLKDEIAAKAALESDNINSDIQESDISQRLDSNQITSNEFLQNHWESPDDRTSFAAFIDEADAVQTNISASVEFAAAAMGEGATTAPSPDDPGADTPKQNTGFNLG